MNTVWKVALGVLAGAAATAGGYWFFGQTASAKVLPPGPPKNEPPGPLLSNEKGPSGLSDQEIATLLAAANLGQNASAISMLASLTANTDPRVQAQLARVRQAMATQGATGLSDAQLATIMAAANAGNATAASIIAAMNVSTKPEVRDQLQRVLASMKIMSASAKKGK